MPQAAPGELVLHALLSTSAYACSLDTIGVLQHRSIADEASPDGMSNSYNGDPMKSLKLSLTLLVATSLLCGGAWAEKPEWAGEGGGKGQKHEKKNQKEGKGSGVVEGTVQGSGQKNQVTRTEVRIGGFFAEPQRLAVREYYVGQAKAGRCPPGLAKKNNGCMPPGQAKKWVVGQPLPRDVVFYPVPQAVTVRLGVAPSGYKYVRVASDILLIAIGTSMVVDAIQDLGSM